MLSGRGLKPAARRWPLFSGTSVTHMSSSKCKISHAQKLAKQVFIQIKW